ncbi:MAG: TRAP transporter substrate-binding protein [Bacillota bacterium]|nr:TRAP transporter substrate-binding protein [Bacillota bacterium]
MKKMIGLLFALVLVALVFAACATDDPADSGEAVVDDATVYEMILATGSAEETTVSQYCIKFKEYIDEHADGRVVVSVYPNAQLGSEREIIEGLQTGSVTMHVGTAAAQANFIPDLAIFDMAFAYKSAEHAREVIADPELLAILNEKYEAAGIKLMGITDGHFRELSSNIMIETPEDLNGLTLRTMDNKYHIAAWQAMGANPTPIPGSEIYVALQQGIVDAQENPLQSIYFDKYYEQQKYVTMTSHIHLTCPIIINLEFWNSLPADIQQLLNEAAAVAFDWSREFADAGLVESRELLEEAGIIFVDLTEEQRQAFADLAKTTWPLIEENVDPEVYEIYVNLLNAE